MELVLPFEITRRSRTTLSDPVHSAAPVNPVMVESIAV